MFFHKAINDQSCKLKKSWWQSYLFHVCMLTFLTFGREFSVWELFVCSSASNSSKSFYFCLVVTLWKYEYCLIWVLNKSILFGRNSLKVSLLCDMYSEKFFTIVQFGRKSLKISVLLMSEKVFSIVWDITPWNWEYGLIWNQTKSVNTFLFFIFCQIFHYYMF